jgi:hypothetical protein
METFLSTLVFAAFVVAQVAAVVAIQRERDRRHPQAFDSALKDRRARMILLSGG